MKEATNLNISRKENRLSLDWESILIELSSGVIKNFLEVRVVWFLASVIEEIFLKFEFKPLSIQLQTYFLKL